MTLSLYTCVFLLSLASTQGLKLYIRDPATSTHDEAELSPYDVFNDFANTGHWIANKDKNGVANGESISGSGSEVAVTATVRKCLGEWIHKYNVSLFLDVPCGDGNWQGLIPGIDNIAYRGYDIAELAVKRAQEKNAKHASMSFDTLDLTSAIPAEKPDMIMVRDVIQHLTLTQGTSMLLNAKRSGAKYLAVTSFASTKENKGAPQTGRFYFNNVHIHPFNMPSAIESCENYVHDGNSLAKKGDRLELIDLSAWNPDS